MGEGAPECPKPNCDDKSGDAAYDAMTDAGCLNDCSSDTCRDHYFMLRAVHDSCPDGALSTTAEKGLHDMEKPCADQVCNQPGAGTEPPKCVDHDGHDHGDGHEGHDHDCACEAEEFGFKIDCADKTTMETSLEKIKSLKCDEDCSKDGCEVPWLIVQTHHDYCPEEDMPEAVEDGFHDFDSVCTHCKIARQFTEGAPECPKPNCDDKSGDAAYEAMTDAGCLNDCSSDTCRDHYFMLR